MQNQSQKQKKRQKCTHMSAEECKRLRSEIKLGPCDMCRILGIPRRTYQDYEAGRRGIPESVATQIREAYRRNREFMAGLPARIETWFFRDFPGGVIPSVHVEKEGEGL
ncbi:hypothetical protein GURASL_13370 [Geotalea uraniireducens]|uniref:HTH cro/C1-type domain-containing protein n=1 Tax=Geotalea uraniireducens TaxID=351604 RepID=A0ABM8EK91_9BACT|nr:hypothetical protein [Geotalea uraniireducens]BDV42414.1 hypothetical protein GURASL_13370 [Geotalea uraniireducens]